MKTGKTYRVALMGIYHESNTFIERRTTMEDFINGHLKVGDDIFTEYRDAFHEVGGIIEYCHDSNIELIPVFYAEATPGGIVRKEDYEILRERMLSGLTKYLPVDGCLVVPHGAGVAEGYDDMDGDWMSRIRELAGDTPVVGTLDPHANVSRKMISATDTLIAYSTNPHIDQRDTGRLAAKRLKEMLDSGKLPIHIMKRTGIAISIEKQLTSEKPCRLLYKKAEDIRQWDGISSVSIILGFPYADVVDMGTSVIVSSENREIAERAADTLCRMAYEMRENFNGSKTSIEQALTSIVKTNGPTLLLDMGDNVGGGAPGNSTLLLHHIERDTLFRSFSCVHDPEAVTQIFSSDENKMPLQFGASHKEYESIQFNSTVKILHKGAGVFTEKEPRHGGQVKYDMGNIAIVETEKGNTVMLTSRRVPPFSLRQITNFGIRPSDYDVIVAKGVIAPIAAYKEVCPVYIQVDTPGYTQADMTRFIFTKRSKPLYPFE